MTTTQLLIIDGSNVAFSYGKTHFSLTGIDLCIHYLISNNFDNFFIVFPSERKNMIQKSNFYQNYHEKVLFSPKQILGANDNPRKSFDDIFMLELAIKNKGIIVTNDQLQDLYEEAETTFNFAWKHVIRERICNFMIFKNSFMLSPQPYGCDRPEVGMMEFLRGEFENFELPDYTKECTRFRPMNQMKKIEY